MEKEMNQQETLKKFKKLVEEIKVCMFITNNESDDDHTRPMHTVDVEENGTLWFFTNIHSGKVDEIEKDRQVHLTFAHPGKESYLDVMGAGSIVQDKALIKEKWSPVVKAYFPKGVDDPNIALLKVTPQSAYFWEAEAGKMVQFFKMAVAAVTGKPDIAKGSQGALNV